MPSSDTIQLIGVIPTPTMIIGHDMVVDATNLPLDLLLGPNLTGRHFINAVRQPTLIDAIERCAATRTPGKSRYLGRDGVKDTVYVVHIGPFGKDIVLTFEDRTDAEAVGQLRRDFVANVSHELRTPLTALMGFIDTLRGPAKDDPAAQSRFLGLMAREAGRMSRLIDDLLSLSRVEERERMRPATRVDIADLVHATVKDLGQSRPDHPPPVDIRDASQAETVVGDADQLRQVVVNLIENALKYGDPASRVTVTIGARVYHPKLRGEGIEVTVHNNGEPIGAHHIPRLTERFYRVDSHRSREVGGTGLGLAIVKHIVNRHRGRLHIASTAQDGTLVSVVLPTG